MISVLRRHRLIVAAGAAAPLAVLLSGCAGLAAAGTVGAPGAQGGTTASAAGTTGAPAGATTTTPAADGVSASAGDGSRVTAAGAAPCRTSQLRVTVRHVDRSMMQSRELLLFRNTSARTCTLYGYPGVSFVRGDRGVQTGDPARRSGAPKSLVTLKAGAVAHAVLITIDPDVSVGCHPVAVRGFRVYPPNQTTAVFVPAPQRACSAAGKSVPSIDPVRPGAADR